MHDVERQDGEEPGLSGRRQSPELTVPQSAPTGTNLSPMIGVLLLVVQGFVINRLAGVPYPIWSPKYVSLRPSCG